MKNRLIAILGILFLGACMGASAMDLFVASYYNDSVYRFDGSGNYMASLSGGGVSRPWGLAAGPDNNLYVSSVFDGSVARFNPNDGSYIDEFTSGDSIVSGAGITFGPDGNLYVAEGTGASDVQRFNGTTGAYMGAFVTSGSGGLDTASSAVFGPDGNLYVSSENTSQVLQYNGTTGAFMSVFASGNGMANQQQIVFGPDGNLYVANDGGGILRFNGSTGAFIDTFIANGSGGLSSAWALAFQGGDIYVPDHSIGNVLEFDATTGAFISEFIPASAGLGTPKELLFLPEPAAWQTIGLGLLTAGFLWLRFRYRAFRRENSAR